MRLDNEKIAIAIWHGHSHFQFTCSVRSQSLAISSLRQPMESKCHMLKNKSLANSQQSIRACEPCERAWNYILSEPNLQVRLQFQPFHEGPEAKSPTYAISAFLTHRPCEKINVLVLLCFLVICYTALEI